MSTNKLEYYRKGNFIGDGTYGVVHEGIDPSTGKKVAIKRIKQDSYTAGFTRNTLREVATLMELNMTAQPHIVQVS